MATTTMERMQLSAPAGAKGASLRARATVVLGSLADRMRAIHGLVLGYARAKRDMRRLEQLDDRMLRDIGINRSEIASAIYGSPSRERRCHARS